MGLGSAMRVDARDVRPAIGDIADRWTPWPFSASEGRPAQRDQVA
jgi:hypothetical protein